MLAMKVLLVNPPSDNDVSLFTLDDYNKKARSAQIPIGLCYLSSYLKSDHDVKIFDMDANGLSIMSEIDTFQPDIIGITCTIGKWPAVKALAREIFEYTDDTPIAVGGVNPSLYPHETLQCEDIDYVISGFGQIPFKALCDKIEKNPNYIYTDIPNCYTEYNCDKNTRGSFEFVNLDDFPLPDRASLSVEDYTMPFFPENPTTAMLTSLGCPYKCHFCACKNFQPVKLRKPENIALEMKEIERIGIRSVLFNDELFTMNEKRIRKICSHIIDKDVDLNWSVRSRANLVNPEALALMKSAGCFNIHLGIESGTERILERMKKGITIDTIKKSVNTIKEAGLSITASFMLGYPDETADEIFQTIHFASDLELNSVQFYITQPEPRTKLYEEVKHIKNLPNDIYADFTLNPDNVDLTQNIASTLFTKNDMNKFLRYAYGQTTSLYNIKGESK
jgi:radical SAM superfamily enzyme YgiQ (UPF0313 family)